jgi:hypothetical protein
MEALYLQDRAQRRNLTSREAADFEPQQRVHSPRLAAGFFNKNRRAFA